MSTVKWGIIGTGRIAHTFADALSECSGAELYAVASRTEEKARIFAEEHGCGLAFGSYQELAECGDIDIVYIATPMASHFGDSMLCLENGRNVLCEKSVTLNSHELGILLETAEKRGLLFMEAMWMKCQPAYLKAKEWVKNGRIGSVEYIKADFSNIVPFDSKDRLFRADCGGGALLDLSVYPITLAEDFLSSHIKSITSYAHLRDGIDLSNSIILKSGTAYASINAGFEVALRNNAVISGSDGSIVFGDWFHCSGTVTLYDSNRREVETFNNPDNVSGYTYEITEADSCLAEKLTDSRLIPHSRTVNVMEIMDECRRQWGLVFPNEHK